MKSKLNLLPWNYRLRALLRRRLRQWSLAWAGLAVLGLAGWYVAHVAQQAALAEKSVWQRRCAPLERLHQDSLAMRKKLAKRTSHGLYRRLAAEPPPLGPLAIVSRSARQCDGRVRLAEFLLSRSPGPGGGPTRLILKGRSSDNVAAAQLVVALRSAGAFQSVELKSAQSTAVAGSGSCDFCVECVF